MERARRRIKIPIADHDAVEQEGVISSVSRCSEEKSGGEVSKHWIALQGGVRRVKVQPAALNIKRKSRWSWQNGRPGGAVEKSLAASIELENERNVIILERDAKPAFYAQPSAQ